MFRVDTKVDRAIAWMVVMATIALIVVFILGF